LEEIIYFYDYMSTSIHFSSRYILLCFCLLYIPVSCLAQKKKAKPIKKAKAQVVLVEAYTQKSLGGMEGGAPPEVGTHIVIRWDAITPPETFFWRGANGFFPCITLRAHSMKAKSRRPPGMEYILGNVMTNEIMAGDTIMLKPITRGKFPVPAEIPATVTNTLFYKTGDTIWRKFPVPVITKKADIARP